MLNLISLKRHIEDEGTLICRSEDLVEGASCRLVGGDGTLVEDLSDPQFLDPSCTRDGLVCDNNLQPDARMCLDYEIRFLCRGSNISTRAYLFF